MNAIAKMYPKLSAVELSAILMKGAALSAASMERDSGFNSGSSEHEDDLKSLDQSSRDGLITPENSSEDSVEVKLPQAIIKNKRKSTEPLRVIADSELLGPIKKRIRQGEHVKEEKESHLDNHINGDPFRPWAPSDELTPGHPLPTHFPNPADLLVRHPGVTTLHRAISLKPLEHLQQPSSSASSPSSSPCQQQPLALTSKRKSTEPLRVVSDSELLGPIKKRIRYEEDIKEEKDPHLDYQVNGNPFRPWAPSEDLPAAHALPAHFPNPADLLVRHPGVTTLHRAISLKPLEHLQQPSSSASSPSSSPCQQQPLALTSKRKSTEPLRVVSDSELLGPIKKRIRYEEDIKEEKDPHLDYQVNGNPFRPWAPSEDLPAAHALPAHFPNPADLLVRHPGVTTLHRAISLKPLEHLQQQQPSAPSSSASSSSSSSCQQQPLALISKKAPSFKTPSGIRHHSDGSVFVPPHPVEPSRSAAAKSMQPRNYKNMTRERRIEANARERTRVHTISAAYENLRQAVPDYSPAQKLSKLSILRIACSYILNLSRIVGDDYSADGSEPSVDECVEMVTKTILTEGKVKKKKDE